MKLFNTSAASLLLVTAFGVNTVLPALADTIQGGVTRTSTQEKTYLQRHPVVKRTAVGAGVGAGAGALTGLITGKGVMRGAVIGAAAGGSVGLIKSSKTLKKHPVATKVAEGTAIGMGLGLAANRGHNAGKRTVEAGGIGAAVGLGAGLLQKEFQ